MYMDVPVMYVNKSISMLSVFVAHENITITYDETVLKFNFTFYKLVECNHSICYHASLKQIEKKLPCFNTTTGCTYVMLSSSLNVNRALTARHGILRLRNLQDRRTREHLLRPICEPKSSHSNEWWESDYSTSNANESEQYPIFSQQYAKLEPQIWRYGNEQSTLPGWFSSWLFESNINAGGYNVFWSEPHRYVALMTGRSGDSNDNILYDTVELDGAVVSDRHMWYEIIDSKGGAESNRQCYHGIAFAPNATCQRYGVTLLDDSY